MTETAWPGADFRGTARGTGVGGGCVDRVPSGRIRGTLVQAMRPVRCSGLLLSVGFRVRAPNAPPDCSGSIFQGVRVEDLPPPQLVPFDSGKPGNFRGLVPLRADRVYLMVDNVLRLGVRQQISLGGSGDAAASWL